MTVAVTTTADHKMSSIFLLQVSSRLAAKPIGVKDASNNDWQNHLEVLLNVVCLFDSIGNAFSSPAAERNFNFSCQSLLLAILGLPLLFWHPAD